MLTKSDLKYLEQLMRLVVKEETNDLREKVEAIKHLPTKEEFYKKMDEVVTELQTIREEQIVMSGQIADQVRRNLC